MNHMYKRCETIIGTVKNVSNEGVFKSSVFGGFKKKDVLKYVNDINRRNVEEIKGYEERIESINVEKNDFAALLFQKDDSIKSMENSLHERDIKIKELQDMLDNMQNDLTKYKSILRKKELEYQLQVEKTRQLECKVEALHFKGARYDEINKKIGETFTEAKRQADVIVENAQKETCQIVDDTKKSMAIVYQTIINFKDEVFTLRKSLERFCIDLNGKIDNIDVAVNNAAQKLEYDNRELSKKIIDRVEARIHEEKRKIKQNLDTQTKTSKNIDLYEKLINNETKKNKFGNQFDVNNSKNLFSFTMEN